MRPKPIANDDMTPTKQDPIESLRASLIYHKGPAALSQTKNMFEASDLPENGLFDCKFQL